MAERNFIDRLRDLRDDLARNSYVFGLQMENIFKTDRVTDALGINWHNTDFELTMIKDKPDRLQYIKNQTPELCMAAIQKDPFAIQHVKEQTAELSLAAVQKNGLALQFVINQTPEICKVAVLQDIGAAKFVDNFTPEIQIAAYGEKASSIPIRESSEMENETISHTPSISGTVAFRSYRENNYTRAEKLKPIAPNSNMHLGLNSLNDLIGRAEAKKIDSIAETKVPVRKNEMEL